MKKRFWVLFLIALVVFCFFLYKAFYDEARERAINSLNAQQRLHARQAALGIEDYLNHMTNTLNSLLRSEDITKLTLSGKKLIEGFYEAHIGQIRTVIRLDANGRILYSVPYKEVIGTDISGQEHIREIMSSHKSVVSNVFRAVQGFDVVALHVPVFDRGRYDGTIGIGIDFESIAKRYLEGIRIGETGYAWMISRDGTELYCPVPGHTGKTVFENCKDFPSILAMAGEMVKGREGLTTYVFNQVREQKVENVKKYAVYLPVKVGNTFWSIVVASSEEEALSTLVNFRNRLVLIVGLILLGGGFFSFYGLKAVFIVREEEKRKRTEEALHTEKQRFQTLSENAPFGMTMIDEDGVFEYVNPKFRELFGYDLDDVPNGKTWFKRAYPDPTYRSQVISSWIYDLESSKPGEKRGRVFTVTCKDETQKMINFIPVQLGTGENLMTCEDITERRRAEETLRESEDRYRTIFETTVTATVILEEDTTISLANAEFEKLSGFSREEIEGKKSWTAFVVKEDLERMTKYHYARREDPSSAPRSYEFRFLNKQGNVRNIFLTIANIPGTRKTVASLLDMSDHMRVEEALRKSEEEAKRLARENAIMAEIGRIISSTLDIEDVYERFAEEVRKVIPFDRIVIDLGNPEQRVISIAYVSGIDIAGRRVGDVIPYVGSDTEHIVNTRSSLFIQTEDETEISKRFPVLLPTFRAGIRSMISIPLISKDQVIGGLHIRSVKPNAYTEFELRLAEKIGNQIAGAIANAQLFTERQRLEERLRRAEKMEALGTLAGGVDHDLNNVLGVLVGYSELLLMEIHEGSPLRRDVSNILQSSQRAAAIIQDLLTLARRGVAVSEVANLNRMISDYFKTPEFEELKAYHPLVTFRSDLDKDLLNIKGSPIHLTKTIMNLLSNAAEAITDHGEVTILAENRYLDKPVTGYDHIQEGDYVVLRVSDNGEGISTKDLGKIF